MVRTRGVVLTEEAGAEVRDAEAAAVSLEGTRLDVTGAAELPLPLLLLVAGACEVGAGSFEVGAGSSVVVGGAAEDAGGALDAGGADDGCGAAEEVAGAADEAGVLPPVPDAWRFSLWCRYSLMPSMCRPSKLKADAMATRANSVTNNHAWRIMMSMSGAEERATADREEAADGCGSIYCG